jgi:sortase A
VVRQAPAGAGRGTFVETLPDPDSKESTVSPAAPSPWRAAQVLGTAASIFGVLLVLFAAYLYGYTNLQASRSQRRLLSTYAVSGENPAFAGHTPADGAPAGILTIPSIGLSQVIVQGTSATDLQNGPGLMPKGAVPGSRGDAVIAGRHGTYGSPFGQLASLHVGSVVRVVDYLGRFNYRVTAVRVLGASSSVAIQPTVQSVLTLLTSRSSLPPSGLLEVTAVLTGKPLATAIASPPTSTSEIALGGDTSWWWQLLIWFGLLVSALVATVWAYRRQRRSALVYLLSTPVLLVAVLFTFENAARLLPATM